jgi:hypothetical protein
MADVAKYAMERGFNPAHPMVMGMWFRDVMVSPASYVRQNEWVHIFFEQRLTEGEKSPRGNFLLSSFV